MFRRMILLALICLLAPTAAHAAVWTADPAKSDWGEDEIYGAYARWIGQLPENQLQDAYDRMKAIARRNPGGSMAAMLEAQIWDCSSTAVYLWVRFLHDTRLPMQMPIFLADDHGGGKTVTYTQSFSDFDSVKDPEDRFLYYVKLLQNLTFVKDLSSELTYPIKLSALQAGTVNLSKTHTRVISGVVKGDPEGHPMLVTGQWIYTTRWAASTAFAQLEPFQDDGGDLGLRLFRVTVKDGDGYRLKKASEHKRYGAGEQKRAGETNFRKALFNANGMEYHDSMLLEYADTIFGEWMEYRDLYIRTHPYPEFSSEHATTQANDQRMVRFYEDMTQIEQKPDVIAKLGRNYLSKKKFKLEFRDFKGWQATGDITVRLFGDTFRRYQRRLSDPMQPVADRMLTIQDFLNQASSEVPPVQMTAFVDLLKGSGQKINLRENRVWIRRMSPEAQMELTPYLEF